MKLGIVFMISLFSFSAAHAAEEVASCEIDVPQALIFGNVDAFELNNSFGITFGYSPTLTTVTASTSTSFLVSNSSMALSLFAADPISQVDLFSSYVSQEQTKTTINAEVDFAKLSAKPEAVLDSPLAQVSLSALEQSVANLSAQLKQLPWTGRVLQVAGNGLVVLNAGSLANVHVGDKFKIYNVQNFWSGEPCKSAYENSFRNPVAAAELTIVQTASSTSFGRLTSGKSTEAVSPGAEVRIEKLGGHGGRRLKRKVKLGTIASRTIVVPGTTTSSTNSKTGTAKSSTGSAGKGSGSSTFDFTGAMAAQIQAVILKSDLVAD